MLRTLLGFWIVTFSLTASAATYHVDSATGNDARSGLAPNQAWKSLDPVNARTFQPGDRILFMAGTRYVGQLKPQGSGQIADGKINPIVIGRYGEGERPRIDGEGKFVDTLLIRNVEGWEIQDLEITNLSPQRQPWQTGVHIISDNFGPMRHIHLKNLYVHDVNGDLRKNREGCGIFFESRGGNQSRFDDLLIEKCHLVRTDRNGICQRTTSGARSTRVIIRGNLLEDIGGDGIKPWGSNGAVVEHNILRGGRMRCDDYAAGIWPWDCDDTLIQFNEVGGVKGTKDGQGFDSDYRCRNSVFQYNYSHDNEGGFFLICSPGNSYCDGTIIRYNISQNDGINSARVFQISGNVTNTQIYNNTIYIGPRQELPLLLFKDWDRGNPKNTQFYNNIFYVDGKVSYIWGKSTGNIFENNVFFGQHAEIPAGKGSLTTRPPLAASGAGGQGMNSLAGYKLQPNAPPLLGKTIPNNGGRDFFGQPVPADRPPTIGAAQN